MASLHSPLVYYGKGLWCSAVPLTTVEDNTYIAPVLKVSAQLFVPVQTGAGDYEDQHVVVTRDPQTTSSPHALWSPVIFRGMCVEVLSPSLSLLMLDLAMGDR